MGRRKDKAFIVKMMQILELLYRTQIFMNDKKVEMKCKLMSVCEFQKLWSVSYEMPFFQPSGSGRRRPTVAICSQRLQGDLRGQRSAAHLVRGT